MKRGLFISLEGPEGTGKSTQSRLLVEALNARGISAVLTREPGGTRAGQAMRTVLLDPAHKGLDPVAELLLYNADRAQHLAELILPNIERGVTVVTDRYSDSTMAYQGYGRGLDRGLIARLDEIATRGRKPDLTILLDIDVREGLARNRSADKHEDRFELELGEFHERVRKGFLEIQRAEPGRIALVDAAAPMDQVRGRILDIVLEKLCAA